jgi:hypothetical protein
MRLGQLARKLALKPGEISDFLTSQQVDIGTEFNTRLEKEHVALIIQHFAPDGYIDEANIPEAPVIMEKAAPTVSVEIPEPPIEAQLQEGHEVSQPQEHSMVELNKTEVIKAPKIELTGLKVIGKIDLPEPKKKATADGGVVQPPENAGTERQKHSTPRDKEIIHRKVDRPESRIRKNPIALQREREAMEEEKRKQEKAERDKEKRTRNYLKKVKASAPTKPLKLMREQTEELSEETKTPKTVLGRFFKWLTTP